MTLPAETICFKPDTAERKRFFKAASFAHPAKMILGLQFYLIERHTKPGDTILDPMAGSGTILVACTLGRNVVLVELENKFVKMQQDNWQKVKSLGPMLGFQMGKATILQGDARNLDGILADSCIFSPPYAEAHNQKIGGVTDKNRPDLIPYSWIKTDNPDNISNLPYGRADAVITSPPYEEMIQKGGKALAEKIKASPNSMARMVNGYSNNSSNIGNLKGQTYLEAMFEVYRQCHKVLKEKGLMILVVKNFIRNKKIVRLDLDTIKICEKAGFKLKERLKRKLTQQSFWRTIYYQKFPNVPKIKYEDVLVFERAE